MTALAENPRPVDIVRAAIPPLGWILQARVLEIVAEQGVTKRVAVATLLLLACGEIEAEQRGSQMWLRWRSGR